MPFPAEGSSDKPFPEQEKGLNCCRSIYRTEFMAGRIRKIIDHREAAPFCGKRYLCGARNERALTGPPLRREGYRWTQTLRSAAGCGGLDGRTVRGGSGFLLCVANGWLSFGEAHPQPLLCGGCAGFCHPEEKTPESTLSSRSRGNPYDQKIHHLKGARGPPVVSVFIWRFRW